MSNFVEYQTYENIDIYIRSLTHFFMKEFQNSDYQLEQKMLICHFVIVSHASKCTNSDCFCKDILLNEELLKEEHVQQEFLIQHIAYLLNFYEKRLTNQEIDLKNNLNLLYASYSIDVLKIPTKTLAKLSYLKSNQQNMSTKQKQILQTLLTRCDKEYELFFNNSIYQNQRLQIKKVSDFDQDVAKLEQLIKYCLMQMRDLFIFLSQDTINLEQLIVINTEIIKKRKKVELQLTMLFDLNPQNIQLLRNAEIFIQNFDMQNRNINHFVQNSNHEMNEFLIKKDLGINLFNSNSCALFVSLHQPFGHIKSVSNSIQNILEISAKDCLNKNVNIIMPPEIAERHDSILNLFLQSGSLKMISAESLLTFGYNPRKFLVPLQKRIKLDYTHEDFGVSGFLQTISHYAEFLLGNINNQVIGSTEKIFKICFAQCFDDTDQLKEISLNRLIPLIPVYLKSGKVIENVNTLMFYPLNEQEIEIMKEDNEETFDQQMLDYFPNINLCTTGFLEIQCNYSINAQKAQSYQFNYVEILKFRRIRRKREKLEQFNKLKQLINKLLEINIPMTSKEDIKSMRSQQSLCSQKSAKSFKSSRSNRSQRSQKQSIMQNANANILNNVQPENSFFQIKENVIDEKDSLDEEINQDEENKQMDSPETEIKIKFAQNIDNKDENQLSSNNQNENQQQQQSQEQQFSNQILNANENSEQQDNINQSSTQNLQQQSQLQQQQQIEQILQPQQIIIIPEKNVSIQDQNEQQIVDNLLNSPIINTKNQTQTQDMQSPIVIKNVEQAVNVMHQAKNFQKGVQNKRQRLDQKQNNYFSSESEQFSEYFTLGNDVGGSHQSSMQVEDGQNLNDRKDKYAGEQNSINSSLKSDQSKKNLIMKSILSKQQPKVILCVNYIGWLALAILLTSSAVVYLSLNTSINYAIKTFDNISVDPELKEKLSAVIYNREFLRISNYQNEQSILKFNDQTLDNLNYQTNEFLSFNNNIFRQLVVKQSLDTTMQFYTYNHNDMNLLLFDELGHSNKNTFTINYALIMLVHFNMRYSRSSDSVPTRNFMQQNFQSYLQQLENLMQNQTNDAFDTLDNIKYVIIVTLIIIEIVGLFIIMILFPIYKMVQTKRQNILKLFGTFSQEKLNNYLNNIEQQMIKETSATKSIFARGKTNQKKKSISLTTELSKFSIFILIISIISFVIISLYPIINLIITFDFVNSFQYNVKELITFFGLKAHCINTFALHYLQINQNLEGQTIKDSQLQEFNNLIEKNTDFLNSIYAIETHFQTNRKFAETYIYFIRQSLNQNVCKLIFVEFPHLAKNLINPDIFNYFSQNCEKFLGGIFSNGIIIVLQSYFQKFDQLLDIYKKKDLSTFLFEVKQFNSDNNIYEMHQSYKIVNQLYQIIKGLLLDISNLHMQDIQFTQQILFIISILLLSLMFLFGWTFFLKYMNQSLNQVKQMLGLINIEYLIENTYILHFINQELLQNKVM